MKSILCSIILFLAMFFVMPLKVKGQNIIEQQLFGIWVFDFESSLMLMNESAKKLYNKKDNVYQNKIQHAYRNRRITFFVDGNYVQELANGRQAKGNWIFYDNTIEVTNSVNQKIRFKIKSLIKDVLIIIPINDNDGNSNMLFSQWYLVKSEDKNKSKETK